jgi:transcriptional regulator with XRE-family HTH domain
MEDKPQGVTGHHTPLADELDEALAKRIRELRTEAGLTQQQLAERMTLAGSKMHQTTIAKIEAGERPVVVGEAVLLAALLNASLDDLIAVAGATDKSSNAMRRAARELEARNAVRALEREVEKRRVELTMAQLALQSAEERLIAAEANLAKLAFGDDE